MSPHSNKTTDQLGREALISKRKFYRIWSVIGALLIAGLILYIMGILSGPVSVLAWTMIIVFCLRGIVNFCETKGLNRAVGTAIAYVVLFVVLILVAILITSPMFGVGEQLGHLFQSLPDYVTAFSSWFSQFASKYSNILDNPMVTQWLSTAQESASKWASGIAASSAESIVSVTSGLANAAVSIGLAMVIAFWVLMELPALGREVKRLTPEHRLQDAELLHATFTRVMGGYIEATLLQCLVIMVGLGIVLLLIGAPTPWALGFIAGLFTVIPIIGPIVGGVFVFLVCVLSNPITAIIAVIATVVIENVVFTFVTPRIMSNSVDVHPALSLFVIVVGSSVGGALGGLVGSLVGMLASIPATAVMKSLFVYYFEKKTKKQIVAEDGVLFKGKASETGEIDAIKDATQSHPGLSSSIKIPLGTMSFPSITGKISKVEEDEEQPIDPYEPQTEKPNPAHMRNDR